MQAKLPVSVGCLKCLESGVSPAVASLPEWLYIDKVKVKIVPVHGMKVYGENRLQLHSFLTSAIDKDEYTERRPP